MIRSYGSTLLSPGTSVKPAEPSIGAHWTSLIGTASRLLSASDRRLSMIIFPIRCHSSVSPSNATDVPGLPPEDAPAAAARSGDTCFLRRRKFKGTRSVLRFPAVLADRLHDGCVGERRGVAQGSALGDVAEEPAHDLAAPGLGEIGGEHEGLWLGDGADLGG